MKYIRVKKKHDLVLDLQYIVTRDTNSPLISIEIHNLCKKFARDLQKIPLSEELQKR